MNVVESHWKSVGLGEFLLPLAGREIDPEQVITSVRERMEMRSGTGPFGITTANSKSIADTAEQIAKYIELMARPLKNPD